MAFRDRLKTRYFCTFFLKAIKDCLGRTTKSQNQYFVFLFFIFNDPNIQPISVVPLVLFQQYTVYHQFCGVNFGLSVLKIFFIWDCNIKASCVFVFQFFAKRVIQYRHFYIAVFKLILYFLTNWLKIRGERLLRSGCQLQNLSFFLYYIKKTKRGEEAQNIKRISLIDLMICGPSFSA